jgi:SAM-dependent methyltransferase
VSSIEDKLNRWCALVPGLARIGNHMWALEGTAEIHFPSGGHASIAEVEAKSYWFNHRNAVIASVARRYPPRGLLFDIGGGNGYVSIGLRDAGIECVVVEPGPIGAANAEKRGFAVIRAPFQYLKLPDASIPSAGMFDVLEHIPDDEAALGNLYRLLMPGGRLYIAVPSYRFLWSDEDDRAGHFRRYTVGQLSSRLKQAGFAIDYATYFFAVLLAPILLMRALPARLGLRLPESVDRDHSLPRGAMGGMISRSLRHERDKIAAGRSLKFGASCLVVARKP